MMNRLRYSLPVLLMPGYGIVSRYSIGVGIRVARLTVPSSAVRHGIASSG